MATAFAVIAFLVCLQRTATEVSTQLPSGDLRISSSESSLLPTATPTVSSLMSASPTSTIISSSSSMTDDNTTSSISNPLSSSPSYSSLPTSIQISPTATLPVAQMNNNSTGSQGFVSASITASSVPPDSVLVTTDSLIVTDEITEIYITTPMVSLEETTLRAPPSSTASIILSTPVQSHAASYSSNAGRLSASPIPPLPTESPFSFAGD
ncbi:uncharacterized protein [Diadema antillarum]|uniref:uncharacterized protein n=1 Tax=Diadema antillarum TaxID=105358 RepID=UPI003A87C3F6